jgi:rhamnosyltransferase
VIQDLLSIVKASQQSLPRFAVCLAAYNGVNYLPEQLESIFTQINVNVTVYISVDTSLDGTEEWVDARARDDTRIVVLPHGRHFGGAAKNFFRILLETDFLEFDYVCFADQDDIWLKNKLIHSHEVLLLTGADAYSSNVIAFWPNGRKILIEKSQRQTKWDFLFEAAGPGCTYVMKKNLIYAIQEVLISNWDEMQEVGLHDWFSYAFARANGYHWVIDSYASMLYRQHEVNQVGVNSGWRALAYRIRKVLNGWGMTQSRLITRLVKLENDPFVSKCLDGNRFGLLWLALHANQCRRRIRDRWFFALSCILLWIIDGRKK